MGGSDGWFTAFKKRKRISYRSTTNISQKTPNDYEKIIREFHKTIRSLASKGQKDGSGDNLINIEGLSDYKVQEQEEGLYEMDTDSDDSDVDSDSD